MKYLTLIGLFLTIIISSCQKEVIRPIVDEEVMSTRGSNRNPDLNDNENGGITDPDNESEEDKIKNKKKKAR